MTCLTCHGGKLEFALTGEDLERYRKLAANPPASAPADRFNHGDSFKGKAPRVKVPETCGECHADVARMNPYGLPTDQLAQYRVSGHGKAIFEKGSLKAAVCTDCHGVHDVLSPKNPQSRVFPSNVPGTCGKCHGDPQIMEGTKLSTGIVPEYRESVHGRGLLEGGDVGMPHCATCHGSHAAVPPGYRAAGHVCGKCHQQEEQQFLQSLHGKFPDFPRCVGCHLPSLMRHDHRIQRVVASPAAIEKTFAQIAATMPAATIDDPALIETYQAVRQPAARPFQEYCRRCHAPNRQIGHRVFLPHIDDFAVKVGEDMYQQVRRAELLYAAAAVRVKQMAHGILLVEDEAVLVEEMRTKLVSIGPAQHTLDLEKVKTIVDEEAVIARQVHQSLDKKEADLYWRHWVLRPLWAFLLLMSVALYVKFKQLKAAWVVSQHK